MIEGQAEVTWGLVVLTISGASRKKKVQFAVLCSDMMHSMYNIDLCLWCISEIAITGCEQSPNVAGATSK